MSLRKVKIVIEETGPRKPDGDQPFIVYMEGDKERIGTIPDDDLSAAEFWGSHLFRICAATVANSGALKTVTEMPKGKGH